MILIGIVGRRLKCSLVKLTEFYKLWEFGFVDFVIMDNDLNMLKCIGMNFASCF